MATSKPHGQPARPGAPRASRAKGASGTPGATVAAVALVGLVGALGVGAWLFAGPTGTPGGASEGADALAGVAPAQPTRPVPSAAPDPASPTPVDAASSAPKRDAYALGFNEQGVDLLERGDLEGAIERFEGALDLWPEVDVYANNLAEALFRSAKARWDAEPAEALARLERALLVLRDEGRRAELTPLRDRWRRSLAAEDGYWTTSSPYFAVSFDGTRRELMNNAHEVLTDLDTYYGEYGDLFGHRPVEEGRAKIRVVFYERATFDEVTGLGDWAGGVFDGTIRVPIGSLATERERLRSVLRHELMHAFIQHVSGGNAPAWLNEGLAQWIERPGEGRTLDVALARAKLRGHELFRLDELHGSLAAWTDKAAIGRAYAQALVLVDHLAFSKGEGLVFELVAAAKAGGVSGPEAHFLTRFPGFPLAEFAETVPR